MALTAGVVFSWFPLAYFLTLLTTPDLPTQVRYAGVLLEIFGFILVAIGIRQTRKRFGRPSLLTKFVQWVKLLASTFQKPKTQAIGLSGIESLALVGDVSISLGAPKDASVERRVDVLERNLDILRAELRQKTERLQESFSELEKAVKVEVSERISASESISVKLEELAVGGLKLESVGLV